MIEPPERCPVCGDSYGHQKIVLDGEGAEFRFYHTDLVNQKDVCTRTQPASPASRRAPCTGD